MHNRKEITKHSDEQYSHCMNNPPNAVFAQRCLGLFSSNKWVRLRQSSINIVNGIPRTYMNRNVTAKNVYPTCSPSWHVMEKSWTNNDCSIPSIFWHFHIWKTLVDKPGNSSKTIRITIFDVASLICVRFSSDLPLQSLAIKHARRIWSKQEIGNIIWIVKRSKKETDKPQLFFESTVKKSKLKMPSGRATCMNSIGHGTLSKTFGILEKICKNEINILNCPTNLFVAFRCVMDLDRSIPSCWLLPRVM